MAQTIKLKRSSVQNNVPSTSDLDLGELAINTYDGKLFIKKNDGSAAIVQVGGIVGTSELTDGSVTTTKIANNAVTTAKLADNSVGITQLNVSDGSSGQVLTTNGSGALSFSTVSSGASNQNAFSNVAVSGQSTIAADATTDTLNIVAGSGIQLTTNAGSDSLTITSTATGSVTEAFKNIAVSGQSNVVADGATDTLTLVGGTNMTITTNASNDTITFASSGGGTGTTGGIDSQVFNGDGTDTTFTLTTAPSTEDNLWVFVDGVYQNKDSYSVSGTTLTMADAPDNGTKLAVHHVRVGVPANNSITAAQLASPLSLTGDFAVDTNVLKVDSTNNRVGINVTTPAHPLDVVGKANFTGDVDISGSLDVLGNIEVGDGHLIGDDSNDNLVINSSSGESILVGSNQHIFFNTGATSLTSQGTTRMIVNSSGKVGIGTSSPSYTLHVNSTDGILIPVGTTAQRPTGAEGVFRYNSNDGQFEGYTASGWGAIAGSGGGSSSTFLVQELTGNGSTTAFTLEKTVTSEDNLIVFNEGVFQRQDSYAAANTTITFDTAPANGNKLVVYQMETGVVGVAPKIDTMTGDGSDTTLTLSVAPASENQTIVNIDGVTQHKATYSVSGTTLTFSSPPPSGSAVECITLTNMSVTTIGDDDLDTKIHFDETADDDVIRFDTAGTERMNIGGTGKVGVGVASPSGKLHIKTETDTGVSHGLIVERNNATDKGYINYQGGAFRMVATDGDPIKFGHASNDNRLEIGAGGDAIFSGGLTVTGNFTVNGTTTTLNSTSLTIDDKNITLASGAANAAAANGAGITVDGASATLLYASSGDKFVFNKPLDVTGNSTATNQIATTSVYSNNGVYYGASTLDLKDSSSASFLSFASNKNATFAGGITAGTAGVSTQDHRVPAGAGYITYSPSNGGSDTLTIRKYGTTQQFFDANGVYFPNGSIGIGTTSPLTGVKLDVRGGNIHVGGYGSGADYGIRYSAPDNSSHWYTYADTGGELVFGRSGTVGSLEKVRFDDEGNVGIGTSAPSEKLVVNVNSTGIKAGLILNNQHGYGSGVGVAATALQFGRDNSPDNGQTIISGQIYSGNENETTSNPSMMAFSTKSGTSPYTLTERMRISSTGNVGIGTSNPSFPLHINTGTTDVAKFQTSGSYTYTRFQNSSKTWALSVGSGFGFYDEAASATRMVIDSSGNVGIGAASPSVRLDTRLSTTTGKVAEFHNNAGYGIGFTVEGDGGVNTINSESNQALAFATGGASNEKMRITTAGNVHLNTGLDARIQLGTSGTGATSVSDNSVYVRGNDDALILGAAGNGSISFKENTATRMYIKAGGNVGIGTSNPAKLLNLQDNSDPTIMFTKQYSSTSGSIGSIVFGNGNWDSSMASIRAIQDGTNDSGKLEFQTQADASGGEQTRLTIKSDGKVGIGTTNANHDAKFNLAGTGDNGIQVYMQHNETYVVGQLIGSAGVSTKTATLVFETNHLRACTIEMETSGHKYNNGNDYWHTRHFYTCMSEGANTRLNSRISNHEFEEGGTNRMTTSLTKTTGSNVWTAVITINGEYQGNFHFRMQGYGAVNCPTSLTIA